MALHLCKIVLQYFFALAKTHHHMKNLLHIFLFLTLSINISLKAENVNFLFYSEEVEVTYDPQMVTDLNVTLDSEAAFLKFYNHLENTNYLMVLGHLFHYKTEMRLNDWLFFILIYETADKMYTGQQENYKVLFSWFIMQKAGYTVQLVSSNASSLSLCVFTTDILYDVPYATDEKKTVTIIDEYNHQTLRMGYYANITAIFKNTQSSSSLSYNKIIPSPSKLVGRPFYFTMKETPIFSKPVVEKREYRFIHDNAEYHFSANINKSLIYTFHSYPQFSVKGHLPTPLSPEARNSLLPQLKEAIKDMPQYEAIRFLLSFTRQSFQYETDWVAYKKSNLTFFAEETLFYKNSDCEDRSILFYALTKELLGLDVQIITYPDHVTTAVLLDNPVGHTLEYNNKIYTICDPTGPGNHLLPGDIPENYQNATPSLAD